METLKPTSPEELADALGAAASRSQRVTLGGAFSKNRMGGPITPADVTISTSGLRRILQYEPADLTISVEAGLPYRELSRVLAQNRQMIPLDPPFADQATIGGVIMSNGSGPRRRGYGTARDMVIGMRFATLAGKLVKSGGMVVKNVAGLDMGKLMIGSFGTLAAVAVLNFKLMPMPSGSRTFRMDFNSAAQAIAVRDSIVRGVLQPTALDLLNPAASDAGWVLLAQVGGNPVLLERYARELSGAAVADETVWNSVREFTARFSAVVRVSCTIQEVQSVMESFPGPALARAASGVCYGGFDRSTDAAAWLEQAQRKGWRAVIESAPEAEKSSLTMWPEPGAEFGVMQQIKGMLDPKGLLNKGRLYGRI